MSAFAGPEISNDGLVLSLDAGNKKSYPGTGTTWFDLSGGNRHYTFGSGITWNSDGYFTCNGTGIFTGPASNTFEFLSTNVHTIEAIAQVTSVAVNTNFFWWYATPTGGGNTRAIATHMPYGNQIYYDVGGCCASNQRINYAHSNLTTRIEHFTWRTRVDTTPNRQFMRNLNVEMNSGSNSTNSSTWNLTDAAIIADDWIGNIYSFRVYNRALSDIELRQNFNAVRGRFGI
jgi:hypothetical protein